MDPRYYGYANIFSCIDMCVEICVDMCVDMCVDKCADMYVDMCVALCTDMCIDICVGICVDMCADMRRTRSQPSRRGAHFKIRHAYTHAMGMPSAMPTWMRMAALQRKGQRIVATMPNKVHATPTNGLVAVLRRWPYCAGGRIALVAVSHRRYCAAPAYGAVAT